MLNRLLPEARRLLAVTRRATALAALLAVAAAVNGCAPPLNWRDVRGEGSMLQWQMPCRPDQQQRTVQLAGQAVAMTLHACSAQDLAFGVTQAEVAEPAQVGAALQALAQAAAANIGVTGQPKLRPGAPKGATPSALAGSARIEGRRPDGSPVSTRVLVFSKGRWVFQVTVLGTEVPEEAAQTFFQSMHFAS